MSPAKKQKEKEKETEPTNEPKSGCYIFPNGDRYEGEYIQLPDNVLERDGNGTHSSCDGTSYEGTWSKDKMHGYGKIRFPSGAFYEGNFQENKFHGAGTYCWPNGSYFRGTFIENKMEGAGEFTDTEGQIWCGNFWKRLAPDLRFKITN